MINRLRPWCASGMALKSFNGTLTLSNLRPVILGVLPYSLKDGNGERDRNRQSKALARDPSGIPIAYRSGLRWKRRKRFSGIMVNENISPTTLGDSVLDTAKVAPNMAMTILISSIAS